MAALRDVLDQLTTPGDLFTSEADQRVRCHACAHRCLLKPGQRGICRVRFNREGELRVPSGYVLSAQTDPVEKKPFTHLFPGSDALTFGMVGCNFQCDFCQNWVSAQALREPSARIGGQHLQRVLPAQLVRHAIQTGARVVASSYNEPLITTEWAVSIFKEARQAGLKTAFVSNGFATPETLAYLRPHLDACKIDLKSMRAEGYRELGGRLQDVLETIQRLVEMGVWVEVVTLVIPGFNDSAEELWDLSRFLVSTSRDIPWHVTAFHPDYQRLQTESTPAAALLRAAEIGEEAGLRYIYAGNLPGRVGSLENTYCPQCRARLITRRGYLIEEYRLTADGTCPDCATSVAGLWTENPASVRLGGWGLPRRAQF
jgi:pyruvate formate lyase activating enzyme